MTKSRRSPEIDERGLIGPTYRSRLHGEHYLPQAAQSSAGRSKTAGTHPGNLAASMTHQVAAQAEWRVGGNGRSLVRDPTHDHKGE